MEKERFTFFYGGPFSQFRPCSFVVDGITYCTCEQYMMAEKARLFGDKESEQKIMATTDPHQQKALGKAVKGFNKEKWNSVARDVVYKGNYAKFQQSEELKHDLLRTKGATLVEASPSDQIWGIGMGAGDIRAESRQYWRGTNWLGEVLTKVRDDLDQGICTTENFNWSDNKSGDFPVKITNKTGNNLWAWDYDKIKTQTSELSRMFGRIEAAEVIIRETKDNHKEAVEAEILVTCKNANNLMAKSTSGSLIVAFNDALHKVKRQLTDSKKVNV